MKIFEQVIEIKETFLDLLGHMNNAKYLELFEQARWDAIVPKGFGVDYIRQSKTGPVILDIQIRFLREVLAREKVTITVEVAEYSGKIGKLKQQMIKSDGEIACEAMFTFGLMDMQQRRLIQPSPEWRRALGMDT